MAIFRNPGVNLRNCLALRKKSHSRMGNHTVFKLNLRMGTQSLHLIMVFPKWGFTMKYPICFQNDKMGLFWILSSKSPAKQDKTISCECPQTAPNFIRLRRMNALLCQELFGKIVKRLLSEILKPFLSRFSAAFRGDTTKGSNHNREVLKPVKGMIPW